ncbi:MAG TPA: glycosyltransferase family 4 protein, partial [Gemmataceae bacterium]|nr:glycosyltransferase family 4 protein [Gemmataceae bacterium]
MRILRIADIPDNRTTGMTRAMYGSGDALAAAGHQVDYLFMDRIGGIRSPRVRRFATPLRLPAVLRRMMREANAYDIAEVHETLAAPLLFLRRFQRRMPAVVLFCHGLAIRAHAADLEYRKLKGLPVSIRNRYSPLAEVFQAMYAIRRSDHILCCNSDDVQRLVDSGVPSALISVHQNGVPDAFLRAGADLADAASTRSGILFLGSW